MSKLIVDWQDAFIARARMEALRPVHVATQGLTTQSYRYPFWGVLFFFQNLRPLAPILLSVLVPYSVIHLYVYSILFTALLPLNVFVSILTSGPVGIQTGLLLTINQCSFVNNYLFKEYLIPGKLNKVFDTTLCLSGLDTVVIPGKLKRVVPKSFGSKVMSVNPITIGAQCVHWSYKMWVSYLPIIGALITTYNESINTAVTAQQRMWQLTRMRPRQIKYQAKENEVDYFLFGLISQILESLPLLGIFFCFTNTVGAALMAADKWKLNHPDQYAFKHTESSDLLLITTDQP